MPPLPWGGRWLRPQPFFLSLCMYIRVPMADAAIAIVTGAVAVAVTMAVAAAVRRGSPMLQ